MEIQTVVNMPACCTICNHSSLAYNEHQCQKHRVEVRTYNYCTDFVKDTGIKQFITLEEEEA